MITSAERIPRRDCTLCLLVPLCLVGCAACLVGCASGGPGRVAYSDIPRELQKASLPTYRVEPPDILLIEGVNAIRLPETPLRAGDVLFVSLGNPEPIEPIDPNANPVEAEYEAQIQARFKNVDGQYTVQPDGTIDLGPIYGSVRVAGLTVPQAEEAIREHLEAYSRNEAGAPAGIQNLLVSVTLPNLAWPQPIQGEHLVRPDGTVSLGVYGSVHVAGLTLSEVKACIEAHLRQFLENPEVSVDVAAYNSKTIYVITDGGGYGEQVIQLPVTGNETVLDAVSRIEGLSQVSSKRIWVARPAPAGTECAQVMDVHWKDITREGITDTNYQLFPGDRVYIQADSLIAFDNLLGKTLAPFERLMGVTLLGAQTTFAVQGKSLQSTGGTGAF